MDCILCTIELCYILDLFCVTNQTLQVTILLQGFFQGKQVTSINLINVGNYLVDCYTGTCQKKGQKFKVFFECVHNHQNRYSFEHIT